jgi:uncharacterized protein
VLDTIVQNPFVFYSVILVTSILSASLGVGGSVILLPLSILYFGSKEGVGIVTLYYLFQNIAKIFFFRSHIRWEVALRIIVWSVPGAIVGGFLLDYLPLELFKKLLAAFILLYLANELLRFIPKKVRGMEVIPIFGVLYGFFSGLLGSGNLVKGPLFASMGLKKEAYIATYALTSFFVNVPKLSVYFATGIINLHSVRLSLPLLLVSIVGILIGRRWIRHVPHHVFDIILNISFALSAVALLI